ncbi:MAG: hypothetical protein AB7C89_02210 [Intestinibacillus sp.]
MKFTNRKFGKPLVLIVAMIMVAAAAVGGTMAWLQVSTGAQDNTFQNATITGTIVEDFSSGGSVKRNVKVQNTSNIDVYVRVALVPTWQDADGNVLPQTASASNLSFTLGANWFKGSDGYYYYKNAVAPNVGTGNLADSIEPTGGPAGAKMNLQVLSEVIQANPADAAQEAWGVTVNTDGTISK